MSTYIKPLMKELEDKPYFGNIPVQKVYPIKDNVDTVGFRLSVEEARTIALQLLMACEVSEEIFLSGSRKNNKVWIARYK
jgi:hypothetical protein